MDRRGGYLSGGDHGVGQLVQLPVQLPAPENACLQGQLLVLVYS